MLPTPFQASKGWDAYKYWESSNERYMVDGHLYWCVTRVAFPCSSLPTILDYMGKNKANNGIMATIGGAKSRDLERNEPTFIQFYRMVPAARTPGGQPYLIFQDELLAYDLDNPPDFKWKNPSCTTFPPAFYPPSSSPSMPLCVNMG